MLDCALLEYEVPDGTEPWLNLSKFKHGLGANVVMPWSILRTAIIASKPFQRARRPVFTRDTEIASWGKVVVLVKGEQLDQDDFDVLAQILRLSLEQPVRGEVVTVQFGAKELLRAIDGPDADVSGTARKRLHERLYRLMDNSYTFRIPGLMDDRMHLVNRVTSNLGNDPFRYQVLDYTVQLNSDILALFGGGRYTVVNGRVRQALKKNHLALWLHGFFSTHSAQVQPFTKTLKGLAGRGLILDAKGKVLVPEQQESKWQNDLKEALTLLKNATGWHACRLEDDKVLVEKVDPKVIEKARKAAKQKQGVTATAATGTPDTPFVRRAAWLEMLTLPQLEWLSLEVGNLSSPGDVIDEEATQFYLGLLLSDPFPPLADMQARMAKSPFYLDI